MPSHSTSGNEAPSSAYDSVRVCIEIERGQLRRLLAMYSALIARSRQTPPTDTEVAALAAMVHSFYTGIEGIFKRVALDIDEEPPAGAASHRELLYRMATPTDRRPALISAMIGWWAALGMTPTPSLPAASVSSPSRATSRRAWWEPES